MEPMPKISIVIAVRHGQSTIPAIDAAKRLEYPKKLLEILVARGMQPAVQRNKAVRKATGEIIYFLDDDSLPDKGNLKRALQHFSGMNADIVGGPSICPKDAPQQEQLFHKVMGSWLAFGPSSARYRNTGRVRETNEKELILCNLMVRKSIFLKHGGFDEALHPNEENALMDMVEKGGGKLVYDPHIIVHRRPRHTTGQFLDMLLGYGEGRAKQFRLHPSPNSLFNFLPAFFCFYLLLLPFLPFWTIWPLVAYGTTVLAHALFLRRSSIHIKGSFVLLVVLCHVCYGLGFWKGLFISFEPQARRPIKTVTIEVATSARQNDKS